MLKYSTDNEELFGFFFILHSILVLFFKKDVFSVLCSEISIFLLQD